ncbi:MAG TPA: winged helix-turn-helix domain-containing protein [Chitinophagaceae bacterium]|nr:winged helix-turn-helix domain-containing protein [Chitinophagaceae bacterium]
MHNQPFSIEGYIWVNKGAECFIGPGRVTLLNAIIKEGSINAAAKLLGMPYQQAWKVIEQMNRLAPVPVLVIKRGGKNGGGAELTGYGKRIIAEVNRMEIMFAKLLSGLNEAHNFCF